jgi:hypothetical protein
MNTERRLRLCPDGVTIRTNSTEFDASLDTPSILGGFNESPRIAPNMDGRFFLMPLMDHLGEK